MIHQFQNNFTLLLPFFHPHRGSCKPQAHFERSAQTWELDNSLLTASRLCFKNFSYSTLQLLPEKHWGGSKPWTYPLWNTSNLIPLDRIARRKPLWFRLIFNLNNWLYSTVRYRKMKESCESRTMCRAPLHAHTQTSLSQFGPFVKDMSHPYESPSQEVISVVNKVVSTCNSSSVTLLLQGQKPNCRQTKLWGGDSKLLESPNWRI